MGPMLWPLQRRLSWQTFIILLVGLSTRIAASALQTVKGFSGSVGVLGDLLGVGWFIDFKIYYLAQVHSLLAGGVPYLTFGYWSMPGFVYLLAGGFLLGGYLGAGAVVFLSDALTGLVIYKIAKLRAPDSVALASALIYIILPLTVISEGYLWLDMQPMLLFILLGVYCLRTDRLFLSGLLIGAGVLMKQEAIPVLVVMLAFVAMSPGWRQRMKAFGSGLISLIALGLGPFLIVAPGNFINDVTFLPLFTATQIPSPITKAYDFTTINPVCSITANGVNMVVSGPASCLSEIPGGLAVARVEAILNSVYAPIALPLAVFVGILVVMFIRKRMVGVETVSSYAIALGFTLMTFHGIFGYYLIPVYALLLASVNDARGLLILTPLLVVSVLLGTRILLFGVFLTLIALIVYRVDAAKAVVGNVGKI